MNIFKEIADAISDANSYTATNVTAVKVNVEWAREALKEMEQLADEEQCRALGYILLWLKSRPAGGTMAEVLSRLYEKLQKEGLSSIASPAWPNRA